MINCVDSKRWDANNNYRSYFQNHFAVVRKATRAIVLIGGGRTVVVSYHSGQSPGGRRAPTSTASRLRGANPVQWQGNSSTAARHNNFIGI